MLDIFHPFVVVSAVLCGISLGRHRGGNTNRLNQLVRKAGSMTGRKLDTIKALLERRILNKLLPVLDHSDNPLHPLLDKQQSSFSNRLVQLCCHRVRYRKSVLPNAITLLNRSV